MRELGKMPILEGQKVVLEWMDSASEVLQKEAKLAGLLGHSVMVGNAREFFVEKVLRTILPPSLHYGSGVVIDSEGRKSKQIDVIVYESQFPLLETRPGEGVYFAEGVVAAIEVKSTLNEAELKKAMNNCLSIARLATVGPKMRRPTTSIFAFNATSKKCKTFADHVDRFIVENSIDIGSHHLLPEFIVAGPYLGMARGRNFFSNLAGRDREKIDREYGKEFDTVFSSWRVENPFSWLLVNLLICCSQRMSEFHATVAERYSPMRLLNDRDLKDKKLAYSVAKRSES